MNSGSLFLFDIDGTLLRAGTEVHKRAFAYAYREVYGVDLSLDGIPAAGRTDTWLLAEPLRALGWPDERIWERMPRAFVAMQDFAESHLGDLRPNVLPGIRDLLAKLQDRGHLLGLLTGNLSRIAWAKMRHAHLDQYFQCGGFGEESEIRAHLVPVALAEAARVAGHPYPPDRAVVIGDTAMDVEAAQAHGLRSIGVATGTVSVQALRESGADVVLESFTDVETGLRLAEALVSSRPGDRTSG